MDNQITSITLGMRGYPFLLSKIHNPPKRLYYKGVLPQKDDILLAVVGSRKMTHYGKAVVKKLLPEVVREGIGIVSGLAYGVDAEALQITVKNEGKAYGVLGGGLDEKTFYPKRNLALAKQMLEHNGAIVSEYASGTPPLPQNFAIRNRIVAGMCHAVLIIEAARKSGTLITADLALQENREILTVPNNIFEHGAQGTNMLLKQGAHLVTEPEEILSILRVEKKIVITETGNCSAEHDVLAICKKPTHIDTIAETLNLTAKSAGVILSELEIQGFVKNIGGNIYLQT